MLGAITRKFRESCESGSYVLWKKLQAKTKLKIRNEAFKVFIAADTDLQTAQEAVDKKLVQLRNCIKGVKGEESDEYVAAGGKRRSEITAQTQATRAEKKKAPTQKV